MDFIEAVEQMKEGKTAKHNDSYYKIENGNFVRYYNGVNQGSCAFDLDDMEAIDWEIVDDSTLFDKGIININYGQCYNHYDVKAHLKNIEDKLVARFEHATEIRTILKQEVGKELLQ